MLVPTEWLDGKLHTRLVLDGERIEIVYQPVAIERGPGPPLATFKVQCNVRHYTGSLTYTADDLTMMPLAFAEFANDLQHVLDGGVQEAKVASVGGELVLPVLFPICSQIEDFPVSFMQRQKWAVTCTSTYDDLVIS